MTEKWKHYLERWSGAGLIDTDTAERIRTFEAEHEEEQGMRTPVLIALALGCIAIGAGVLLFVAAHWDQMSPMTRLALVVMMVAGFHLAGAFSQEKSPMLATALHALGTVSLGAGIYLTAQIFNLNEHWPGGVMLWALGAWLAYILLRDLPHAMLCALLTPAWLVSEWIEATDRYRFNDSILAICLLTLAITYLSAEVPTRKSDVRRMLSILGMIGVIPMVCFVWESSYRYEGFFFWAHTDVSYETTLIGLVLGTGGALFLSWLLRGRAAWINGVAAVWTVILSSIHRHTWWEFKSPMLYIWCAIGALAMVAWGLHESERKRINLGVTAFALTVFTFYVSDVFDMLGRSEALISIGVVFLVGGWAFERARRKLIARIAVTKNPIQGGGQ
jgi:uncharacterized membrane protein